MTVISPIQLTTTRFAGREIVSQFEINHKDTIVSSAPVSIRLTDAGLPHRTQYQGLMSEIQERTGVNPHRQWGSEVKDMNVRELINAVRGQFANFEAGKMTTPNQLKRTVNQLQRLIDRKLPDGRSEVGC